MTRKRTGLAMCATLLMIGCAGAPPDGSETAAVTGGAPDSSDKSVGIIYRVDSGELCTGVLIDRFTVLTAAHCIDDLSTVPISAVKPANIVFYTGSGAGGAASGNSRYNPASDSTMTAHAVQQAAVDPSFVIGGNGGCPNDHDVALVSLVSATWGDTPIYPLSMSAASDPKPGAAATAIGFGVNSVGNIGARYSAQSTVTAVNVGTYGDAITVQSGAGAGGGLAGSGDSGGPLVYGGNVVGITMCHDPNATPATEWYTSITGSLQWILATQTAWDSTRDNNCRSECNGAAQTCRNGGGSDCVCGNTYTNCMIFCDGIIATPIFCPIHFF